MRRGQVAESEPRIHAAQRKLAALARIYARAIQRFEEQAAANPSDGEDAKVRTSDDSRARGSIPH
jgi:hypothetical protein